MRKGGEDSEGIEKEKGSKGERCFQRKENVERGQGEDEFGGM